MKLAYSPSALGVDAATLVDITVEAERLGYEEAWVPEVSGPEAFGLSGAIAVRTERMRVGVAVVPSTTRTPALMAMGAGTVSQLLGGRSFTLGIGASSQVIVAGWHGQEFSPPLGLVRESVEGTRAALAGERDYEGEHFRMRRFRLTSPPIGPVPIYVGALGPKMLRLAGAIGDGACLNLMPPSAVPGQIAEIRAGAEAAGRELPDDFGVMARLHTVVTDDIGRARATVRAAFGPYFAQPVYNRFLAWYGYREEAAAIAEAWAAGDREALGVAFHDGLADAVALVGPPGAIRDRLDEFAAAGITVAALNFLTHDAVSLAAAVRALAPN